MTDSAGAGTVVVTDGNVVVAAGKVDVLSGNVVVLSGTVVVLSGNVVVDAGAVGLTEFEATDAALLPIALIATTVKV
jgi:lipopolysaccharide export system protein LptA